MENNIRDILMEKQEELWEIKRKLQEQIRHSSTGRLHISQSNGKPQYYLRRKNAMGKEENCYICNSQLSLAKEIAQRDYEMKILEEIDKEISCLEQVLQNYHPETLEKIYTDEYEKRKRLIQPHFITEEEFVNEWCSYSFEGKAFSAESQEIYTEKGERVRSKSEKIIADMLYHSEIPYRYECPLYLKGLGKVYPDFTCLHVKKRKVILWEHMGMLSDPVYCKAALKKKEIYTKNGFRMGREIIYTHECSDYSLSTKLIDQIIQDTFGT